MSCLIYLTLVSIKNSFLEVLRKPSKLVLYLFVIAIIAVALLPSLFPAREGGGQGDLVNVLWLGGIFFAYMLLFVILGLGRAFKSGSTFFEMSDVNLLFVAPLSPKTILVFGVVRLMKTGFLAGFFILFQGQTLRNFFGVNFGGLLVLLGVIMLCLILEEILSLVLYSAIHGRPRRQRLTKVLIILFFVPFALQVAAGALQMAEPLRALEAALVSPFFTGIPITGWGAASVMALLSGQTSTGLLWLALIVGVSAALTVLLTRMQTDYYEDVLCATETAFEKKRLLSEGNINAANRTERKIKVAATGLSGFGARTFLSKHLRETLRENRWGLLGGRTLFMVGGAALAAYLMPEGTNSLILLEVFMWVQTFLIGMGRGLKELYSPYIYLIPATPLAKMLWSNLELILKVLVESVLIFGAAGVIIGDSILLIAGVVLTYVLFSLLLISVNYLLLRWTGATVSNGILIIIYMLAVLIILLPGLIAALVVGFAVGGWGGGLAGLGILSAWELAATLICLTLSKGILHRCDMPTTKIK